MIGAKESSRRAIAARVGVVVMLGAFALGATPAGAATITPSTTSDENGGGASCSLREAIESANDNGDFGGCNTGSEVAGAYGADTITLTGGPYNVTTVGNLEEDNATGDLDVKGGGALTIRGSVGQASISMPGNILLDRVIDMTAANTLTLENLSIGAGDVDTLGATDGRGGAIRSGSDNSVLSLSNVELQSSDAVHGGGIYMGGDGSQLFVTDSEINGNLATQSGGGISLVQGPTATVTRSSIEFNDAISDSNAIGVNGGGIAGLDASLTVTDSQLIENTATDADAAAPNDALGGAISMDDGDLTIRRALLGANPSESANGNSVSAAGVNDALGGAVHFSGGNHDDALLVNTTVSNNSAASAGTGLIAGGGIHNASNQTEVDLTHVTFALNSATDAANGDHVHSLGGAVTYTASILPGGGGSNPCDGTGFISGGFNALSPDAECDDSGPGDIDAGVVGLASSEPQDNGGPFPTIALGASGTALDRVPVASCGGAEGTDQRSYPRPFNGTACDAGAYERITCPNGTLLNGPGAFPGCPPLATPQTPAATPTQPAAKKKKCKKKKKGKKGAATIAAKKCKKKGRK